MYTRGTVYHTDADAGKWGLAAGEGIWYNYKNAQESDVQKTLAALEARLCPVWAMLKGNVEISVEYSIHGDW